ncbi:MULTISPECIES: tRNA (adenosine(37)-N6)-dimethylallyltransferase MiaA [unclassified Corynebacterium]|uniref:tRNA (adenosine(37)-N6)-dimethylallyltransferase MiaA n=1 Tax=unclassified Corynebacterium TaxID=2624378 RepID=UPI0037BE7B82
MAATLPHPVAIIGPTASGKSSLSIALAHHLNAEIVNTDSMQLYRGMDIGTAKLTVGEREGIPHHLLDILDVTERASVANYQARAIACVEDIQRRGKTPLLVGGSMLYVQSLIDDWQFPPTDPGVRAYWEQRLETDGIDQLHAYLHHLDPVAAEIIEDKDPRRTVRALEVIELTGQPYKASQPDKSAAPRWNTTIIGLATTPEWLNPRIEQRTHLMFDRGFAAEVENLYRNHGLRADSTAGSAIGYSQMLEVLTGNMDLEEAWEKTVIGTRRYVRRQRSWFRRDPRVQWIKASGDTLSQTMDILETISAP